MRHTAIITFLLVITSIAFSQVKMYDGYWKGEIKNNDTLFQVEFSVFNELTKSGSKTKIIRGLMRKPVLCLLNDSCSNDSILYLKSSSNGIEYKGSVTLDKNKMSGEFIFKDKVYAIDLRRGIDTIYRPQEPKKPFPYISDDIYFTNDKDSVKLAGTLTIPNREGCFPAAILISGSNPSDRNGDSYYHQKFLVLADYLARNGIAVLRYDDRGVNESTGNYYESTPDNFAQDVIAGINFLSSRKEIDKNKIGLIGHSGGGIVASIVASQNNNIKYIVLLASPGISGKEDFLLQTDLKLKTGDYTVKQHAFFYKFYDLCYRMIEKGYDKKTMIDTLSRLEKDFLLLQPTDNSRKKQEHEPAFFSILTLSISPNNCFYIKCIPSVYLEKVTCPVLSLNGTNDILVPAKINQEAIRNALIRGCNPDFNILELEGLNHSFQECKTGSLKEYFKIEQTISPSVLELISKWINEHTKE